MDPCMEHGSTNAIPTQASFIISPLPNFHEQIDVHICYGQEHVIGELDQVEVVRYVRSI
jgi:hypothetical protein